MNPETTIDARFGDEHATPTPWSTAEEILDTAEIFWLTTVRRDGRPHTVPVLAVWADGALCLSTGRTEQKVVNLNGNDRVTVMTTRGENSFGGGLDIVIEGAAERTTDRELLQQVADRFRSKYDWNFTVTDEGLTNEEHGHPIVLRIAPKTAFGFSRNPYSQTRWRFS
jgi:general stress protein 26